MFRLPILRGVVLCLVMAAGTSCRLNSGSVEVFEAPATRGNNQAEKATGHGDSVRPSISARDKPDHPSIADNQYPSNTLTFCTMSSRAGRSIADAARELAPIRRLGPGRVILFEVPPNLSRPRLDDILGVPWSVPERALRNATSSAVAMTDRPLPIIAVDMTGRVRSQHTASARQPAAEPGWPRQFAGLIRLLRKYPAGAPVVLCPNVPYARLKRLQAWQRLQDFLAGSGRSVTVVCGSAELFSSWVDDGIRYIAIGHLVLDPEAVSVAENGRVPGFLWADRRSDRPPVFNIIDARGFMDLADIQRRDQLKMKRLAATLKVTPVDDLEPVTTLTLKNITETQLKFRAHWGFQQSEVKVVPQVVDFQLDPKEEYKQQFRFQYGADRSIRLIQPELVLHTELLNSNGDVHPVKLRAAPYCRIAATLSFTDKSLDLDGKMAEWRVADYLLGHPLQLHGGQAAAENTWGGTRDASGSVRFGWHPDTLQVGMRVTDDLILGHPGNTKEAQESVTLYIFADDQPVQKLRVWSNGEYFMTEPLDKQAQPEVAVAGFEDGYGFEARIPAGFFSAATPDMIRVEVVLSDIDEPRGDRKLLVLSGKLDKQGVPITDLYARFACEKAGTGDVDSDKE